MTFNQFTDRWYDKLTDYIAKQKMTPALQCFYHRAKCAPSKANLVNLRYWLLQTKIPERCKLMLRAHIDAILDLEFRKEFRFHFAPKRNASACSELFSMIQQTAA